MVSVVRADLVLILSYHERKMVQASWGATRTDVTTISEVFHKPRITGWSFTAPRPACGVVVVDGNPNLVDRRLAEKVARPCGHCYREEGA